MAYSEQLAERVRGLLGGSEGMFERKMFGGLCFTLHGNMCCGINGDTLMLRMGEERAREALKEPHTREMDFTGRPLKGMIYVEPAGFTSRASLNRWIMTAIEFVATLPPKEAKSAKTLRKKPTR